MGIADVCGDRTTTVQVSIEPRGAWPPRASAAGTGRSGGHEVHHLVDPDTGLPVDPYWRTVSVAAGSCVDANTASTAAMVKGVGAVTWLERASACRPAWCAPTACAVTAAGWPADHGGGPRPDPAHR